MEEGVSALVLDIGEVKTDPRAIMGQFVDRYSHDIQLELLLGHIPVDVIRDMCAQFDDSLKNSPEIPFETRVAYKNALDYFRSVANGSPRTMVPDFQRAKELYDSLEKRIRMIHFQLRRDEVYRAQRTRRTFH